jgi:hypothetical protein
VRLRSSGMELSALSRLWWCCDPPPLSSCVCPSPTVSTSPAGSSLSLSTTCSSPPLPECSGPGPERLDNLCNRPPRGSWLALSLCSLLLALLIDGGLLLSSTPPCCPRLLLRWNELDGDSAQSPCPYGDSALSPCPLCTGLSCPERELLLLDIAAASFGWVLETSAQSWACRSLPPFFGPGSEPPSPADWALRLSLLLSRRLLRPCPQPSLPSPGTAPRASSLPGADWDADVAAAARMSPLSGADSAADMGVPAAAALASV